MSVIPTVYNQGTGLIGSTTSGAAIPSNIDDLIVNDTLLVGGEATFNGAVTINNTLTVSGVLTFQDVTVQGTFILEGKTPTQLAFYTTGGELTGTADMTYSGGVTTMTNVTVTTALSFGALTKTDSNNYAVAFHDNNRICIAGSPNTLTFNPSEGKLAVPNVTVGDDLTVTSGDVTLTSGDLIITNIPEVQGFDIYQYNNILIRTNDGSIRRDDNLTFRSEDGTLRTERFLGDLEGEVKLRAPDDSASGDCLVPFITPSSFNFIGKLSKNTAFTFNPSTGNLSSGTLTADTVTADFIRIQPLPDTNTSDNVPIIFCDTGDNNTLKQDTEPVRLSYTPSLNKFFTGNAEINNKLDVLGTCEVQGDIDARYSPGSGELTFSLYEKSTGTVYAPLKLWTTGQLEVLGPSYLHLAAFTNNTDYGLCLFDTSTNELGKESIPAQLKYNPNANRLTLRNLTAEVSITAALPGTNFDGEHPCFFQNPGGSNQDRFEKDIDFSHYTYNPGQGRLTVYKLEVTDSANITGLTITPSTRGATSADYQVVFYDATTSQFCIDSNSTQFTYDPNNGILKTPRLTLTNVTVPGTSAEFPLLVYNTGTEEVKRCSSVTNPITCDPVNGKITTTALQLTAATFSDDTNCRVTFLDSNSNTGTLVSNNQLFFNPFNQTLRTTNFRAADEAEVLNLKLTGTAVPTASASLPILVHNNSTNEVQKTNVSGTNQITIDPSQGLFTTKDMYVNGSIYNGLGCVLNYVVTFSTRINGTGDAYTTNATSGSWGASTLIKWPTQASAGGEPTVSQYGENITDGTGTKYGAVVFTESTTDTEFMLLSNAYTGWWFIDISLLWQNTAGTRQMPRIDLGKRLTAGGAILEQPQVNQGSGYTRNDSGELLNLHICGPVYMGSAANKFVILTKLEDATNDIAVPPNWNDTSTAYKGLGLNITCKYLGTKEIGGETVNTL